MRYEFVDCGRSLNPLKDILFDQISGCNLCKIKGRKGYFWGNLGYIKYIRELQIAVRFICSV